jgi:carbohydrate diacid regulator
LVHTVEASDSRVIGQPVRSDAIIGHCFCTNPLEEQLVDPSATSISAPRPTGVATALTPALAQEIAGETSAIVGLNVLITDTAGIVIGSGDVSRVGSFHEASVDVLRTGAQASHTAAEAHKLQGVRAGMTMPILLHGAAVGTVGITGSPRQVTRFGLMVKRQTEILLTESMLLRSRFLRERVLEDLVRDVTTFDPELVDPQSIVDRSREYGLDLTLSRRVLVIDLAGRPSAQDGGDAAALRAVRESFPEQQSVAVVLGSGSVVVLARAADPDVLMGEVRSCLEQLGRRLSVRATVGVGSGADSLPTLRRSYDDAVDAVRLGGSTATDGVCWIDTVRTAQLVAAAGRGFCARYVQAVAGRLTQQNDWFALRETVIAWCENGFSLVRTAAALHIHRNTLVYRLGKIDQLQGWPTRSAQPYLALYLACLADQPRGDSNGPPRPSAGDVRQPDPHG